MHYVKVWGLAFINHYKDTGGYYLNFLILLLKSFD